MPEITQNIESQEYDIITVHHFPCSGGTIISKCLAVMPNVVFLSEVHPRRPIGHRYHPIEQLSKYNFFNEKQAIKYFVDEIEFVLNICRQNNQQLIIRDHAHHDFIASKRNVSLLKKVLSERFKIRSLITVRNPIDSWLSMIPYKWHKPVGTFDEYCLRYLNFLNYFSDTYTEKYEKFVESPDIFMAQICEYCRIEYTPDYKSRIADTKLTGDSGRKSSEISARSRREYDSKFAKEVRQSKKFKTLKHKLNYEGI